jgi:hypothetical protein
MEKTNSKKKAIPKKHESESEAESDSASESEETFHYVESPPPSFPSII